MTATELARAADFKPYYSVVLRIDRPAEEGKAYAGNYRQYGEADAIRLRQICAYRAAGLPLQDVRLLLDQPATDFTAILERRMAQIGEEMEGLSAQQRAIARLLKTKRRGMLTKQKWTQVMKDSGFSEDDMRRWHAQFEKAEPEDHEQFLKFLHIPDEEVQTIREWSRSYKQT